MAAVANAAEHSRDGTPVNRNRRRTLCAHLGQGESKGVVARTGGQRTSKHVGTGSAENRSLQAVIN